jgi:hypothetical protein
MDRGPAGDEDPVKVAEGMGGATGAAAGIGVGAIFGPAGMVVGGLAGAVGGWWAGREFASAADDFSDETDAHYRSLHADRHADRCRYEDARGFYRLGYVARRNPAYEGRPFSEVEPELRLGWRDDEATATGPFRTWDEARPFVSCGYDDAPH